MFEALYLLVNEPELAAEPDGTADAIIEQGPQVGLLASKRFPRRNRGLLYGAASGDSHNKGASSESRSSCDL
jgi:hypothetical protein